MNDELRYFRNVRGAAPQWSANCPCCEPERKNGRGHLQISYGEGGRLLLHCVKCGASFDEIARAAGLPFRKPSRAEAAEYRRNGRTWATMETAIASLERATGGHAAGMWRYNENFVVVRFDTATGKTYRPLHRDRDGWRLGDPPAPLPLYLPAGVPDNGQPIFVVEGEKCADALASIGLHSATSAHGSKSAGRSDWRPLAGRDCVIWPDNDEAGRRYADDVAGILSRLDPPAMVRMIKPLAELPAGGDCADWLDVRDAIEPDELRAGILEIAERARGWQSTGGEAENKHQPLSAEELLAQYPRLRSAVIDGLLREGEIMNLISAPKIGKTALVNDLAICIATGRNWLDNFPTARGRVLILDNELHPETVAHRLGRLADARGVGLDEWGDSVFVDTCRGRSLDLFALEHYFRDIRPGDYRLIILDAFYRFLPIGTDENSNADITGLYNCIDRLADRLQACFIFVHHTSKGLQSNKAVTDVGSGAGAMSRASDTHLILRPHKEEGVFVLDALTRSFPPPERCCLRWNFPLFELAPELDPDDLAEPTSRRRQKSPVADEKPSRKSWTPENFVEAFVSARPRSKDAILIDAGRCGLSERKAERLLSVAEENGLIYRNQAGPSERVRWATTPAPKKISP